MSPSLGFALNVSTIVTTVTVFERTPCVSSVVVPGRRTSCPVAHSPSPAFASVENDAAASVSEEEDEPSPEANDSTFEWVKVRMMRGGVMSGRKPL